MGTYLFQARYTQTGLAGLVKEGGTRRRAALTETVESVGGAVESCYYAFGVNDLVFIAQLPDDAAATAVSLAVGSAGAIDVSVTVLITPETVDEAVARDVAYRPPGA